METPRGNSERPEGEDDDGAYPVPGDDDEQEIPADREAVLDVREARVDAWEAARAARKERARHILADAQERDDQAEARDDVAMTRDTAAGLDSFLHDGEQEYGPALKARRSAALDRTDSRADRSSAAADRSKLTQEDSTPPEADNG